jgi:uncharacterized protein YjbI with pentapeptide repeats
VATEFAGKATFGSDAVAGRLWMTLVDVDDGQGGVLTLPEMAASAPGPHERAILYRRDDGAVLLQLVREHAAEYERWWIGLERSPGWLIAVPGDQPERALAFALTVTADSAELFALVDGARKPVSYEARTGRPLTITAAQPRPFAYGAVTPSLAAIRAAGGAPGADLTDAELGGAALDGLKLAGAHFERAGLTGAKLGGADCTGAAFGAAVLSGTAFGGATLDRASFAHTDVRAVAWGVPASAKGLVLTGCDGRGTKLGSGKRIDCAEANLALADLRGAALDGLDLSRAIAGGALLADGCSCVETLFDDAVLDGANGSGGVFRNVSLQRARAGASSFVDADLRGAKLSGAQFGTKRVLFTIAASFAATLDAQPYASAELVEAFRAGGGAITLRSAITVVAKGARWQVSGTEATYEVAAQGPGEPLAVAYANAGSIPATFAGANLDGAIARGANFAGVDCSRARWSLGDSSLANADCTNASFTAAYLVELDMSQALLAGADFVDAVAIGAKLRGARVGRGAADRRTSFAHALLMGASFDAATVVDASLADAWVALDDGVPLFPLAERFADDLTPARFAAVKTEFARLGYRLGEAASVAGVQRWLVADTGRAFSIEYEPAARKPALRVFARATDALLFKLDESLLPLPGSGPVPEPVRAAFAREGYGLAAGATLERNDYWAIADPDALGAVAYGTLRVVRGTGELLVTGAVTVRFAARGVDGVAFGVSAGLAALNGGTIGPSGFSREQAERHGIPWTSFMRRRRGPAP